MTASDRIAPSALGATGYRKPAAVLLALRNHVLDPETFDAALRLYIRRWAFKHPTPADFFRTIEDYAGEDFSWFWHGFFYTSDVLDLGVERVAMRGRGRVGRRAGGRRCRGRVRPHRRDDTRGGCGRRRAAVA